LRRTDVVTLILTDGMKKALVDVAYGVRKYADGYRSVETGEKVV